MGLSPSSEMNSGKPTHYRMWQVRDVNLCEVKVDLNGSVNSCYKPAVHDRQIQFYGKCGVNATLHRACIHEGVE